MRHGLCCRSDRESAGLMCVMVCVVDLIGSQQVVAPFNVRHGFVL